MAESGKSGRGASMNVDTRLVRELAELLSETGPPKSRRDGDRKIKSPRGGEAAAGAGVSERISCRRSGSRCERAATT